MLDVALDREKTAPFELGEGQDACLLVHGFTGTPWDMRPLGEALARAGYFVRGIRLPGHGTTPRAMETVTYEDWVDAVEGGVDGLAKHRKVFVCGLSMGALLGVVTAARSPSKVSGLALVAPAMRFISNTLRLLQTFREYPLIQVLQPWVEKESTDIEDPQVRAAAPVLLAFPSARLFDLLKVQSLAREAMGRVRAPALVAAAVHDHVVALKGARELERGLVQSRKVRSVTLTSGYHIVPRDRGAPKLEAEVIQFFDEIRSEP